MKKVKTTLDKTSKPPDKRTEDVLITRAEFEAYKKETLNNIEEIQNKVKESSNQTKELVNDVKPLVKQINSLNKDVTILCNETSKLSGAYNKHFIYKLEKLFKDKYVTAKRPSISDFLKRSFFKLVLAGILLTVIIIYIYYHN